jgi:hypothetical protein
LRLVAVEVGLAPVAAQLALPISTDFPNYPNFTPQPSRKDELGRVLDQLESWSNALAAVRA